MLTSAEFSHIVKSVVLSWFTGKTVDQAYLELGDLPKLHSMFRSIIQSRLQTLGYGSAALNEFQNGKPYLHFPDVFTLGDIPHTPTVFRPVVQCHGALFAQVTTIAILASMGLDAVSYRSENQGELFINLVIMPGDNAYGDKSRKAMKGHTDAVSFPVRGRVDPYLPRIAPSPDFVCLAGLRNPNDVATTVIPLGKVLSKLSAADISELKKPQFGIRSQLTFQEGMWEVLGEELVVEDGELLFDVDNEIWARFSHSSVLAPEESSAETALNAFVEACKGCADQIIVRPGDVLLINNRLALHGRTDVLGEPGGESRWLLRTYGLLTDQLSPDQYHKESIHLLYP